MNETAFLRQTDIVPPDKLKFPVTIIGGGAIGSAAVIALTKMGCSSITLYDDDTVEESNLANQLVPTSYVGKPKVDALSYLVELLTDVKINAIAKRYTDKERPSGVVISAVDSMDVRMDIWNSVKGRLGVPLFIDARMGAMILMLYAVNPLDPQDRAFFEENLYPSSEAEHLPCSGRSVCFAPIIASGFIAHAVKCFAMNQPHPRELLLDIPGFGIFPTR